MDWNLLVSTLVTIGTLGTSMWAMLHFMLRDIHRDLSDMKESHKKLDDRMNRNELRLDQTIAAFNARTDIISQTLIQMMQKK